MDTGLLEPPPDPFSLFDQWYADAARNERHDVTAMTLSTVDARGMPNARIVLLKHHDARGFVFYTNFRSTKSRELEARPNASLMFWFPVLECAVRIRGTAARVDDAEADDYFATRPRDSQIGAWASDQSAELDARATLEERIRRYRDKFEGGPVPRPPHWGGWRVTPVEFEFWHEGEARLHDRIVYTLGEGGWTTRRLYP